MSEFLKTLLEFTLSHQCSDNWKRAVIHFVYQELTNRGGMDNKMTGELGAGC
mgnify:CR=1 FL=1